MPPTADPLAQLADIELPPPPAGWPWLLTAILAALAIALLLLYRWRKKNRRAPPAPASLPRQALTQLEQLSAQWRDGQLSDRDAAYRLATLLRRGLALAQLTPDCPTALAAQTAQWRAAMSALSRCRYQPSTASPLPAALFEQVREWLTAVADQDA